MKVDRKQLLILVCLYLIGLFFLAMTNPESLPLPLLIVPFIYVFGVTFLTTRFLVDLFIGNTKLGNSVGLTVAIFVVLSLVLASIRQLSSKDLLLSLAITIILSWYLIKSRKF